MLRNEFKHSKKFDIKYGRMFSFSAFVVIGSENKMGELPRLMHFLATEHKHKIGDTEYEAKTQSLRDQLKDKVDANRSHIVGNMNQNYFFLKRIKPELPKPIRDALQFADVKPLSSRSFP